MAAGEHGDVSAGGAGAPGRRRFGRLLPIAFLAFVSLGLPDGVLGVAWPSLRASFALPLDRLGLLLAAMTAGYLASSFASGALMQRIGVGRLLLWSSVLVSCSAGAYALAGGFGVVLAGGVVAGLGAGAIDAGVNAHAAAHFSARLVTWLHASYGVGAMLGPLVMTGALAAGLGWRAGYAAVATALAGMALCFVATLGEWDRGGASRGARRAAPARPPDAGILETLRQPAVRLNVALFFVYTGLEAAAGQWAYSLLTESRGLSPSLAGVLTAAYWGSLFAGRVCAGAAATRRSAHALLRASTIAAPLAALLLGAARGAGLSAAGLIALGFVLAPVYPLLISLTPERVGARHLGHAVGFQVSAACLGVALLPGAAGVMARAGGLETLGACLAAAALTLLFLHELIERRFRPNSETVGFPRIGADPTSESTPENT